MNTQCVTITGCVFWWCLSAHDAEHEQQQEQGEREHAAGEISELHTQS